MFAQYLLTPSLESCQTWYNGYLQTVDDPYWFSGHMVRGQGQTTRANCCLLNIFWSFAWWSPNLVHWLTLERKLSLLLLWVTRSRSNYRSSYLHCPLNILWTICLVITKLGTVVATIECIIHCIYAMLLHFARGHLSISKPSCWYIIWRQ